eukprot:jgi/Botrbrau1/1528/Bobra.0107s0016.1
MCWQRLLPTAAASRRVVMRHQCFQTWMVGGCVRSCAPPGAFYNEHQGVSPVRGCMGGVGNAEREEKS